MDTSGWPSPNPSTRSRKPSEGWARETIEPGGALCPPPYFSDHGLREVMGTTYTPSDLRYAKEVIPQITQRTDGGRAFPSANFCKRTRFFAASSIILAPNFISNVPISRRKVRSTQVFPHHLGPSTHTYPKESSMNFRRVSAIRGISQKEHHRLHGKMRGLLHTTKCRIAP